MEAFRPLIFKASSREEQQQKSKNTEKEGLYRHLS